MYQLTTRSGGDKGASWPISEIPLILGRGKDCDVRVREMIVSRRHCKLWQDGATIRLRDLGSTNATLVNGQPLPEAVLQAGDEITLGGHVFVITRVHDDESPTFSSDIGMEPPMTEDLSNSLYVQEAEQTADTQRLPRSVYEFRDLFMLSHRFSRASGVAELNEALATALRERFKPDAMWLVHYLPRGGDLIFDPLEGAAPTESAPAVALRSAIDRRAGLLVPRSTPEGKGVRYETTIVAPLVLGEERVGALALRASTPHRAYDEADLNFLVAVANAFAPYLRAAERHDQLRRDYETLRQRSAAPIRLIGDSTPFREALELLRKAAGTKLNVLLLGETGTGKELASRLVHDLSARSGEPFVALNCAAIPRDLFESEMFGHEKGAFTGAAKRRIGRFEEAHRGTLFLDEVADLNPENQARLLRVLETGTFYRVGGSQEIRADVRIVAATNSPLAGRVASGQFREDLYHRLTGFEVRLPALRERPDDIPRLAQHFLDAARAAGGRGPLRFAEEALERMREWTWPGNIRELKACVERAAALAQDEIIRADEILLQPTPGAAAGPGPLLSIAEMEKLHIARVLKVHGGNIRAAAKALRISRPTLYRKIRQYGLG